MSRKVLVGVLIVLVLSASFYVGEFVTGHLHFITKCDPPKELDCPNADLSGSDFSGTDLYDADFSGANLSGVNLRGSSLNFVNFSGADLSDADLSDAYVISSNLQNALLARTNLKGADLSGSDLSLANFSGAILLVTKFENSIFDKTIWIDGSLRTESQSDTLKNDNSNTRKAESLTCRDGFSLNYCQVRWSDGSGSVIMPYGLRQGGVVDSIVYYDVYGDESCVSLYADGSVSASYEMSRCL
jgi:hypothetical protein